MPIIGCQTHSLQISTVLVLACMSFGALGASARRKEYAFCHRCFYQRLEAGRGCDGPSRANAAG